MSDAFKEIPRLSCMCASVRRASRALTQIYDDALRPAGLRATQFTILQALSLAGELSQGELGRLLAVDSTTLTRVLDILERRGWIAKTQGKDRRERRLRLTKTGTARFERALPHWEQAQRQLQTRVGNERWDEFLKCANEITRVAADLTD